MFSENYIHDLSNRIALLPKETWNEGKNHLIFNIYYGTYPEYSQRDIGFDPSYAIMAWASANQAVSLLQYREYEHYSQH